MYIVQTNILTDNNGVEMDFQSIIYTMPKNTWDEFKEYILSDEYELIRILGTMKGFIKPRLVKVVDIMKNDDFRLRVKFNNNVECKYYLVGDKAFNVLR